MPGPRWLGNQQAAIVGAEIQRSVKIIRMRPRPQMRDQLESLRWPWACLRRGALLGRWLCGGRMRLGRSPRGVALSVRKRAPLQATACLVLSTLALRMRPCLFATRRICGLGNCLPPFATHSLVSVRTPAFTLARRTGLGRFGTSGIKRLRRFDTTYDIGCGRRLTAPFTLPASATLVRLTPCRRRPTFWRLVTAVGVHH